VLLVEGLTVRFGSATIIDELTLSIKGGSVVALVGPNGAGKSTFGKAIVNLVKTCSGRIEVHCDGHILPLRERPTWEIARNGVLYVPEENASFEHLSVNENLRVAFAAMKHPLRVTTAETEIYELFPFLSERLTQRAGTLSGGQKKLLALARAYLMMKAHEEARTPYRLLILDEPTHGLSPASIKLVSILIQRLSGSGVAILLLEQMAAFALGLADHGHIFRDGKIVESGSGKDLLSDSSLSAVYFGISS